MPLEKNAIIFIIIEYKGIHKNNIIKSTQFYQKFACAVYFYVKVCHVVSLATC